MNALAPVLVVGAGGMLGSHLCEAARRRALPLLAASSRADAALRFDIRSDDPGRFIDALPQRPQAALVCAAQSNIDACRSDPAASRLLNVSGPQRLFRALLDRGVRVAYFSSDMVFAGERGDYREDDECIPGTEYGRQKRAAEETLLAAGGSALVLRLGKLYARDRRDTSPLSGWLRSWQAGQRTRCAGDQWLMPTWAGDVAEASLKLIGGERSGVVHLVAPQAFTRLELARTLARAWGIGADLIDACSIGDFAFAEPRPLNNCLNRERLEAWLDHDFFPVEQLRYDRQQIATGVN